MPAQVGHRKGREFVPATPEQVRIAFKIQASHSLAIACSSGTPKANAVLWLLNSMSRVASYMMPGLSNEQVRRVTAILPKEHEYYIATLPSAQVQNLEFVKAGRYATVALTPAFQITSLSLPDPTSPIHGKRTVIYAAKPTLG